MKRTLFVSIDGLLGDLGFSQVLRVIEPLSRRGLPYALVSLERAGDLANTARVAELERRLAAAGIPWSWDHYAEGSRAGLAALNMGRLAALALRSTRRNGVGLLHARGYHGGAVARLVRLALGTPYLFDARGYWIDERIEGSRWFTTPRRLAVARAVERRLFADARAVVTLTQLQANDVLAGDFGPADKPVVVIPTCADYDEFRPRPRDALPLVPAEARARLAGKMVLGIIGSYSSAYIGAEMATLIADVMRRRDDAALLVLSGLNDAWRACLTAGGVPDERVLYARANHEAMPEWLNLVDWGLLMLVADSKARSATMPTKLAEFLATGVRPIAHGCNPEMRDWVHRAGHGLVLESVTPEALTAAAEIICAPHAPVDTDAVRALTAPHFSLASGLDRYERLLRQLH